MILQIIFSNLPLTKDRSNVTYPVRVRVKSFMMLRIFWLTNIVTIQYSTVTYNHTGINNCGTLQPCEAKEHKGVILREPVESVYSTYCTILHNTLY
jgi:hypothetical protein